MEKIHSLKSEHQVLLSTGECGGEKTLMGTWVGRGAQSMAATGGEAWVGRGEAPWGWNEGRVESADALINLNFSPQLCQSP